MIKGGRRPILMGKCWKTFYDKSFTKLALIVTVIILTVVMTFKTMKIAKKSAIEKTKEKTES